MGLLSKLFKKEKKIDHVQNLLDLNIYMDTILSQNSYIPKSEYKLKLDGWNKTIDYFKSLKNRKSFNSLCKKNGISNSVVEDILSKYDKFETLIKEHNESFISSALIDEKHYLDNILHDVDPQIKLDEDQRRVILTDEDYCLVIAGAGAGKTTTLAAKVKYLVEKKGIKPSQILVLSFTTKAVNELKDKLNKDLSINCDVKTFHSDGYKIIKKLTSDKLNIVDSSKLTNVIQDYFKASILNNESLVNNLIMFFPECFEVLNKEAKEKDIKDFFNRIAKSDFTTMNDDLSEHKKLAIDSLTKKRISIQNEKMNSQQEVEIANFLYLNNIDYKYNTKYSDDISYTANFIIQQGNKIVAFEHFDITQDLKNNSFSKSELEDYKKNIDYKINLTSQHNIKLIYTFSKYNDGRSILEHLKYELENKEFKLQPRSNKEVMEMLISTEEKYHVKKLVDLLCNFIKNFKTKGCTEKHFYEFYNQAKNVRSKLFLDICKKCYLEYQRYLDENNAIDFEDMINKSEEYLYKLKETENELDLKYIIVDEYQDISQQRYKFVVTLLKVTNSKIIAVGDDWQSIYAFAGSDINLFTEFETIMGYAENLMIRKTYRNSQQLIDIAGKFIKKNKEQISKELESPKNIEDPVIIYTYDEKPKNLKANNENLAIAHAVEEALKQIIKYNNKEGKSDDSSILLLGRFKHDVDKLTKSDLFKYINNKSKLKSVKYPTLNITFMTAHASKGLGFDNVIVINGSNQKHGFPSQKESDPVLSWVTKKENSIKDSEERRLFYVAMTRTKNRVYFIAPKQKPSEFLIEIKRDNKNVILHGKWNEESPQNKITNKICPLCSEPMKQQSNKAINTFCLDICENEQECGFITNQYKAGKLSILKCDKCDDGYLIIKGKENNYFLGCTNYKNDGTGCGNTIAAKQYYEMFNLN